MPFVPFRVPDYTSIGKKVGREGREDNEMLKRGHDGGTKAVPVIQNSSVDCTVSVTEGGSLRGASASWNRSILMTKLTASARLTASITMFR